ncbi:LETM1 domain containing 1 [Seminavis robusta]|uniref:LETM1 domain containing 1 n=1 Tax=Seminavis robusta TaxID=568900 RepID=A0A9N8H7B9_9STRA|nr:LETM1 domain containing 1 [Seminavis robusta]|eukprot:Sro124_g059930.1 LETM1 domain containing 1 (387) ;mRNA; r:68520-69793
MFSSSTATRTGRKYYSYVMQHALDYVKTLIEERRNDVASPQRPQTNWERVQNFPSGVKALLRDCFHYNAIHNTPLEQWTIAYPHVDAPSTAGTATTTIQLGRIPRRQYEQQRLLRDDFRTMLPLVIMWIPPIIGFLPVILAIVTPRQLMSRHFHNPYELEWFAQIEYGQRQQVYNQVADMLWSSFLHSESRHVQKAMTQSMSIASSHDDSSTAAAEDAAGPILDAVTLYRTIFAAGGEQKPHLSIKDLPREHLVKLSLAMGINQYLPGWLSSWVAEFQPSAWLQSQVDRISRVVCKDDDMLIEEGHHLNGCSSLTDQEATDACLMRGLPVGQNATTEERRQCLTNHLRMIAEVRREPATKVESDSFRLFTVHLAPIRNSLKSAKKL